MVLPIQRAVASGVAARRCATIVAAEFNARLRSPMERSAQTIVKAGEKLNPSMTLAVLM